MSSKVRVIDKVVEQAKEQYYELMKSDHVSRRMRIDGIETRGQVEENTRKTNTKEEYTRTATCMDDVKVHRGSYIEICADEDDTEYSLKGVVSTLPNRTPVDYYFQALLFNTTARRYRRQLIYSEDGYVIGDSPLIIDDILCFVQRIGMRERQVNVGIDSDSVNEIITTKDWDIQKDDILYVGSERYKITDIKELDNDLFWGYMTYYRE